MAEYIEREVFLAELKERHDYVMQDPEISKTMKWCEAVCFGRTKDILDGIPAADVAPVVRGQWKGSDFIPGMLTCTSCGAQRNPNFKIGGGKWNYCPNCGAHMKDGEG